MDLKIQEFCDKDAEECCKIAIENWNKILSKVYNEKIVSHFIKQYTPEKFIKSSKKGKIFTAKINNNLAGFIAIKFNSKNIVEIGRLFVSINYQRKGIGSSLIKFFERNYPNIEKIIVKTANLPNTVSFYKKNGFRIEKKLLTDINNVKLKEYLMIKTR